MEVMTLGIDSYVESCILFIFLESRAIKRDLTGAIGHTKLHPFIPPFPSHDARVDKNV